MERSHFTAHFSRPLVISTSLQSILPNNPYFQDRSSYNNKDLKKSSLLVFDLGFQYGRICIGFPRGTEGRGKPSCFFASDADLRAYWKTSLIEQVHGMSNEN